MNLLSKELSLEQEWIAKAKLVRCPTPLPETTLDPVLTRMLEVVPSEEGRRGEQGSYRLREGRFWERRDRESLHPREEEDRL